jgi:protein-disulfide isomerase
MHDILYENQTALGDDDLFRYSAAIGLPETRFATEVVRHVHAERVREDMMGGVRSGVNGTPSFFINGVRHDGSYDLPTLLGAVEARIAGVSGRGGQVH